MITAETVKVCQVCGAREQVVYNAPFMIVLECIWCNILMCRACHNKHECTGKARR